MQNLQGLEGDAAEKSQKWQCAPRETLLLIFKLLSIKERALVVTAVCSWWRQVAVDGDLLPELSLCSVPVLAVRAQQLERFEEQGESFLHWLRPRAPHIHSLILQAERWEAFLHAQDDGRSLALREAIAHTLCPHLHSLKLVSSQGGGRVTQAFLSLGLSLRRLQIDFWGTSNWLPRQLACCSALTSLHLQCSAPLAGSQAIGGLSSLKELAVVDAGWERIPPEVLGLPHLTRLFLRYADFESRDWLVLPPSSGTSGDNCTGGSSGGGSGAESSNTSGGSGSVAGGLPWQDLTLFGCHITALPPAFAALTALTALRLDRNGSLEELPPSLAALSSLQVLSLEGCRSVASLGEGLPALPLRSLNLQETGVLRLPPGSYTSTLTELYWSLPTWAPQLPGCIQSASALRHLYLGGQLEEGQGGQLDLEQVFQVLPRLDKVCVPRVGRVAWRYGKSTRP